MVYPFPSILFYLVYTIIMNTQSTIFSPKDRDMTMDQFVATMRDLTEQSLKGDNTVVRRSPEALKKYYDYTVFLELNWSVIWKSSILPTDKFDLPITINNKNLNVAETTWTIVLPDYRQQWYGSLLIAGTEELLGSQYDIILMWTINNLMSTIRAKRGYEIIPFPNTLYEEWKWFFAPLLDGWEVEFAVRAKCLIKFRQDIDDDTKLQFLSLFSNI